jgi:Domain of unknown function (DUF4426)
LLALLTRRCLGTLSGAVLLAASVGAQAQAHEKRVGEYVLRSSTVATQTFDEATARAHGIDPAPTRAVINVTVSRKSAKGRQNVRADVAVSAASLTGRQHVIDMRPIVENGMVSYLGTFDFVPREVLDFTVVARPEQGDRRIKLVFRDRMWVP